ncbi:hypothetical protein [Salicola sp. Rm-C-2C1-2]|uniref:hypothetical protein n=1 Tax=Salicola sp. Rm-C-2C1-2 TaxID=3141321 RepID=UPI0032E4FF60
MSKWSTLGIEQTHDPESIEAAFEHQLKFVDPDAHPDRYQTLVHAYEAAMREAGADPQEQDYGTEVGNGEPASGDNGASVGMPEPPSQETEIQAGRVMTELETVFSNPGWRDDLRRWRAQLESERAHKPGVTEVLRFKLFDFLSRQARPNEPPLTEDVMTYLDERLGWRQHRSQLEKAFSEDQVRLLLGGGTPGGESPLDMETPFPATGEADGVNGQMPNGFGMALIGWIVVMIILTMLFSGMR